jgi:hypothetical protein
MNGERGKGMPKQRKLARPRLVAVFLEEDIYEKARKVAGQHGLTFSEWVRNLIARELLSSYREEKNVGDLDPLAGGGGGDG